MFKLDPNVSYVIPVHFVPRYTGSGTSGAHRDLLL